MARESSYEPLVTVVGFHHARCAVPHLKPEHQFADNAIAPGAQKSNPGLEPKAILTRRPKMTGLSSHSWPSPTGRIRAFPPPFQCSPPTDKLQDLPRTSPISH
jgi:hypothetical protein